MRQVACEQTNQDTLRAKSTVGVQKIITTESILFTTNIPFADFFFNSTKFLTEMLFGITQLPKCESVLWMSALGTLHPHIFKYSDILASHRDTGLRLVF